MKSKYCFFLLLLLIYSCKKDYKAEKIQVSEITFASSIDIPYEIMYTDFLLSYPKCMILSDDYLIIQDDRGHDFYFHAINRISGELAEDMISIFMQLIEFQVNWQWNMEEKELGRVKYYMRQRILYSIV